MYRLEFELAGLPPTENSHRHWSVAARDRKHWRNIVKLRVYMQRPAKPLSACKITCTRFSSSEPDMDNLMRSFKSVLDGLVDGGIIEDDNTKVIKEYSVRHEFAPKNKGKISVVVEELN